MALAATFVCVLLVAGLFYADREKPARTSKALWLPVIWLVINGSRSVSQWFTGPTNIDTAHYSDGTPGDAVIFALLIGAGLLVLNLRSSKVRKFLQGNLPLLLFFAYCIVSIAWSDFPFVAAKRMVKAIGDIVMVLVVLTDPYPVEAMKRLFARMAFLLLPFSVLLIVAYPSLGGFYDTQSNTMYYSGVTTQKNSLGQTCMVCGLGLLWLLLGALEQRDLPRRKLRIVIYATLLATAAGLIVKADSMTSLSTLALAGAVMVMITQRWVGASRGLLHVVVWSAVGMAVSAIFLDSTVLHALGRNATLTGRTDIWRAVLALHTNPLIGTGYESFWLGDRLQFVWDATDKGILQAHNGYLEIYINMGWIGVILLGALIVTGYRHAVASYYRDPQAGRLGLALFAAALMYNLSEAGFRMMTLIWFVFLMAITGIPASLREREPAYQPAPVRAVSTGRVRVLQ